MGEEQTVNSCLCLADQRHLPNNQCHPGDSRHGANVK